MRIDTKGLINFCRSACSVRIQRQQAGLSKRVCGMADLSKWNTGLDGNIQKVVLAIRQVQGPKHRHLTGRGGLETPHWAVQPAPAKLRFAFRIQVQVTVIFLEDLNDSQQLQERFRKRGRGDQGEVVCRGVVLRVASVWGSHEASNR